MGWKMLKAIVINPARLSIPAQKPAFIDFRLGGPVHEYSIPNTRALLDWLGARVIHCVRRYRAEHFSIHGLGGYHSLDDACIAELICLADRVDFRPNPEDLGIMLRYIALQDKVWGHGFYRPMSEIPSPRPEHAEEFWRRWYSDFCNGGWRKHSTEPYHPNFLRRSK